MSTFADIVAKYQKYSLDGTGSAVQELESLQFLWLDNPSFDKPDEMVDPAKKLVVIIVEARLLEDFNPHRYTNSDFFARLLIFKYDLLREGSQTKFLKLKAYSGSIHQDGKTLLAMREFFREVRNTYKQFEGVILIGSFPEAMIVRTWLRPETYGFDMRNDSGTVIASFPEGTKAYHVGCGIHAYRSEIVLADLDGNWRDLYNQSGTVQSGIFIPDTERSAAGNMVRVTSKKNRYVVNHTAYQDFFWIKDDDWCIESQESDSVLLLINASQANATFSAKCQLNPELCAADKAVPNAIAQPDIFVSRINARHIAANPDSRLLDNNKKPKRIPASPSIKTNIFDWHFDADLERTLLIDYFDRNHAFRMGRFSNQGMRISKIEYELGLFAVNRGLDGVIATSEETGNASLLDFVKWLKKSALLRGIGAHTSGRSACMTVFRDDKKYADIEVETGNHPWRWIEKDGEFIPSFEGHNTADLNLYRTIWENKSLRDLCPSTFLHVGCDANTPDGADNKPYSAPGYGACQSAEGVLFYLNGLAIMSRSKMFYDGPSGFGKGLGASDAAHVGDGWKEHFRTEAVDTGLAENSTDRKRSSFWSVIGDWTVRKQYPTVLPSAKQIVSASNQDGRLALLYIGTDDNLYFNTQITPNGAWTVQNPLGGWAKQITVTANNDGRLEIFYIGTNNALYHNWQISPNGGWTTENWLGGWAKQIAVTRNQDGRLEVFYIGTDDKIYHNWQTTPNGGWTIENWLGGWAKQIVVAKNQDGRLEIFYIGTNNRLYHNWQTTPNGGWTVENSLGGSAKQMVVASNQDGRLEIFYIGTDDKIYHNWQTSPNGCWAIENWLGGWAKQIVVAKNQDGRLEIFYIGTNNRLYHNWQTTPNGGWTIENAF
jgi:hypothetical protein